MITLGNRRVWLTPTVLADQLAASPNLGCKNTRNNAIHPPNPRPWAFMLPVSQTNIPRVLYNRSSAIIYPQTNLSETN